MGEWKQLKIGNGEDIAAFVKNLSQSQTVAPGDSISLLVQSASASALKQELLFNGFQNLESADGTGKDQTLVTAIRSQVSQGGARPLKLARKHVEAKPITEDNNNDDLIDESALIDEADYVKHLRIHSELIVRPRRRLVKIAPVDVLKRNCYVQSLRGLNGTLTMKFNSSNQNNSCDCSCRVTFPACLCFTEKWLLFFIHLQNHQSLQLPHKAMDTQKDQDKLRDSANISSVRDGEDITVKELLIQIRQQQVVITEQILLDH